MSVEITQLTSSQPTATVAQFRVSNQSMSDGIVEFTILDDAPAAIYVLFDYFGFVSPDDNGAQITLNVNWTDDQGHAVVTGETFFQDATSRASVGAMATGSVNDNISVTYPTTIRCAGGAILALLDPGGIGVNNAVVNWTGALVKVA